MVFSHSGSHFLQKNSLKNCPLTLSHLLQRVRLLVAEKGIKSEEINIHLKVKPDWYLEKINPVGKVPTIQHNGNNIPESLIAFGMLFILRASGKYSFKIISCVVLSLYRRSVRGVRVAKGSVLEGKGQALCE